MSDTVIHTGEEARQGLFAFDDHECRSLAQELTTPAFVYRADRVNRQLVALRRWHAGPSQAYTSVRQYDVGSLVLDVEGRRLDAGFVMADGTVGDRFRIEKPTD